MNDIQKHQLRHRELFLTRQNETLLATNIRGKCLVTLHNETELFQSYLNTDVSIFSGNTDFVIVFYIILGSFFLSTRI